MTLSRNLRAGGLRLALAALLGSGALFGAGGLSDAHATDQAGPEDGASVLMYHRFGEDDYPSTNITLDQIDAHIKELTSGGYSALALPDIVGRLKAGEQFPPKSFGVSIDDAYLSVYTEAWPRFKEAGIPFTVFVATDPVDKNFSRYMSWEQIRELAADPLVTIGSQTASHLHMIDADAPTNIADLEKSNRRFREELGFVPNLIAYPYGEFDDDAVAVAKRSGFTAGFGQHSGAFGPSSDIHRLARFAMNETYGDIARLRTAAGALPVAASDFTPADALVSADDNPPALGFTLSDKMANAGRIACYSNHEGTLAIERLGPRVEVRMTKPLPTGRTRINCTMPFTDEHGETRWRWLGRLLYVK